MKRAQGKTTDTNETQPRFAHWEAMVGEFTPEKSTVQPLDVPSGTFKYPLLVYVLLVLFAKMLNGDLDGFILGFQL